MRVTDLRCEHRTSPIDLDTATPTLSWVLKDDARGQKQTAYRILVASTAALLASEHGDLWDSGRVESNRTLQIAYAGKPLGSFATCIWKVQAWDKDNTATPWSDPATFATATLAANDWKAKWITGAAVEDAPPLFRRAFRTDKPVIRAQLYICSLGQFELHCNGQRVSDDMLQPGWTNYKKTCQYVVHDLTALLKQGDNALGVITGHGMYHVGNAPAGTKRYTKFKGSFGPPLLIAQLHLDYADGSRDVIITDEQWQTSPGPITYSNIYGGEDYDARREQPGWADAGAFAANGWSPATPHDGPGGTLRGSSVAAPPVRIARVFAAKVMAEPSPGVVVYDAGQNCSMMPRVVVRGPAGSRIKVSPAESLKEDGTVNQRHTGNPVFYTYTLKGDGEEAWSPRFSYTGGRYLQVETFGPEGDESAKPTIVAIRSQFITSSSPRVGHFECSNDLFNRTAGLIDSAIRSNMVSVLTDCPHREKLGWTEEQHLMGPSLMYAYDLASLYRKAANDHTDAQLPSGDVPTICPQYTKFQPPYEVFNDSPEWGSASILVPWQVFQWYGDEELLRRQYPTMQRYLNYLTSRATDHIVSHGLGDWYDLGPNPPGFAQLTPIALTATATYFHDAEVLSMAANRLGFADDSAKYKAVANEIRSAFNATFYDAGTHQYATKSQTSLAMPLVMGLAPEHDRAAILENLVADVKDHDTNLTSGDVGYRYLLRALAAAGRSDVVFAMNSRSDRPGYGMMLAKGETSLTEAWNAQPQSSLNHFMLGHIQEWFYANLAGLSQAASSIAFDRIVIQPNPVGDVTHASATYASARGEIRVAWSITGGVVTLDCVIPPNTTATVHLPTRDPTSIREGDKTIADIAEVRLISPSTFAVDSGTYHFTAAARP
ncbi:MAG: rhamnosidase [Phycisphaerales bacterium]|nr:rhamnosidase [Phycisphaerales bacterium]